MDEQGVTRPHLAKGRRRDERHAGDALPISVVVAGLAAEPGRDVLLAEQAAQVVQAGGVAHTGEEQLGQVVGEDGLGLFAVCSLDLADRLPGRHELHPDPGEGRGPAAGDDIEHLPSVKRDLDSELDRLRHGDRPPTIGCRAPTGPT